MPLRVLSALDAARIQYYHFKAIIVAGMGMFSDAYSLFCIPPIMKLIGPIYYEDRQGENKYKIPPAAESSMLVIALLGTAIGQLVFGRLGDRLGRRRVYGLALVLMVVGSIGCGFTMGRTKDLVLVSLGFFRFVLGLGIGGDYPLSATIMSEFANKRMRGTFMAAVFSMQGFGILVSSVVTMVVCKVFKKRYAARSPTDPTPEEADVAWRLILMLGAVPAAMTYYWRMMMPETARYTALVEQNVLQAARDMEGVLDVPLSQIAEDQSPNPPSYRLLSKNFFLKHGRDLVTCALAWFLVDIVFYSSNLLQAHIYKIVFDRNIDQGSAFDAAFNVAKLQAVVACCSTIPGYFATVFFIDRIGRLKIQLMGFMCMAAIYFLIGVPYDHWVRHNPKLFFMFPYGLTLFFANFGPNTTTFIMPAEMFPTNFRSTCHGIAGAAGKVGAIIGAVAFLWASEDSEKHDNGKALKMKITLIMLGGVCVTGMVVTKLFSRETMGISLEENEGEIELQEEPVRGKFFLRNYFRL